MSDDATREAIMDAIMSGRGGTMGETADRTLETLRGMGWMQFSWQSTGDVALGHVHTGYPVFSRDQQWVAFVPEPPVDRLAEEQAPE